MVENNFWMTHTTYFATIWLWPDLAQLNSVSMPVFYFLISPRIFGFPARIVLAMISSARKLAFGAFAVANVARRAVTVRAWFCTDVGFKPSCSGLLTGCHAD
jgi:hypothetical protein